MRPYWRLFVFISFFGFSAAALHSADRIPAAPITLQQLPKGDTLEIRYVVHGCSQFTAYSLQFSADKVEISQLCLPEVPRAPIVFDRKPLGSLQLAQAGIEALDRTLNYFRRPDHIISTTSVNLHLKQFRQGNLVREENIVHVEDEKPEPEGLLRIHTLIERLQQLKDVPSS